MKDPARHAAADAATEPDGAPRLASLDILRGIAILGILFMNINDMGASLNASFGDVRHIGWTAADQAVWWTRRVFADGTARGMLEMLFGAGMVILTGRFVDNEDTLAAAARYYWRNVVLFLFGLVHVVVLLWPGDILHTYAIAALVIFPLRRLRPRLLLTLGLSLAAFQLATGSAGYLGVQSDLAARDGVRADRALTNPQRDALERLASREQARAAAAREVAAEDMARTGTAASWARWQWHQALGFQQRGLEIFVIWEAAAAMLIGAALFKLGWLQGGRPASAYLRALVIAYAVAVPLRMIETGEVMRFDLSPRLSDSFFEIGRLAMTLGHVFAINWLLVSGWGARVLAPFRAAGQTALSIYIVQTIVTLWVLYPPWGFALYGRSGWVALMLTALAIDAVLLVLANWWVRRFRIAPVEWAWRSIVAGRRLPFRRERTG